MPASLEAIVLRCLAKLPTDRYPTAEALRQDLARCADFDPWSDRQAASWWAQHGALLRAHRDGRRADREQRDGELALPPAFDRAVTVDWSRRYRQVS